MSAAPLVLQWGRERYMFKYDDEDLRHITLGQFREVCREATGVPSNAMKLIFNGGKVHLRICKTHR